METDYLKGNYGNRKTSDFVWKFVNLCRKCELAVVS